MSSPLTLTLLDPLYLGLMAKKQKKVRKSKNKQTAKPRTRKMTVPPAMVSAVCSIIDPFCDHASNGKTFDGSNARTIPWSFRFRTSITTDASGNGCLLMLPYYTYYAASPNMATAWPTGDFSFSPNMGTTGMPTTAIKYRMVSQGWRIQATGALLNRKGVLRLRMLTDNPGSTSLIPVRTYNADHCADYAMANLREPVSIVNRKTNAPIADSFTDIATNTPNANYVNAVPNGWSILCIAVDGAEVSTSVLEIELFSHYEIIFNDTEPMQQMATRTNPPNALIQNVIAKVQDQASVMIVGGAQKVSGYLLDKAVKSLATAVGGYLGGPAGAVALPMLLAPNVD